MLWRSLGLPWVSITVPVPGSYRTGMMSFQVNGTPMVAVVRFVGTFCLSIFSTGIRRLRQCCWTAVDELLTNQILFPWALRLHDMFPVCTTLSKISRKLVELFPYQLMLLVSGFDAG